MNLNRIGMDHIVCVGVLTFKTPDYKKEKG